MVILTWLLAGGLTGWAASFYIGKRRTEALAANIAAAVLGAAFFGWAGAPLLGAPTGYELVEFLALTISAAAVLACVHLLQRLLARCAREARWFERPRGARALPLANEAGLAAAASSAARVGPRVVSVSRATRS
jgi:uncharacterized membrane protein YeaQ/YmgE (transglycosylase-associated protein family)